MKVNTNLDHRLEVLRGDAVAPVEGHARLAGLEDLASRARVRGAASPSDGRGAAQSRRGRTRAALPRLHQNRRRQPI